MPIYTLQGPDGKTYDVQGPDGATADQLGAFITQSMKSSTPQQTPKGGYDVVDGTGVNAITLHYDSPPPETTGSNSVPGIGASIGAGLGHGMGEAALGAQQLVGHGLSAIGLDSAGNWLSQDAAQGLKKIDAEYAPYESANPTTAGISNAVGSIAPYVMGGEWAGIGKLGAAAGRIADAIPKVGKVLAPVVIAATQGIAYSAPLPFRGDDQNYWSNAGTNAEVGGLLGGVAGGVMKAVPNVVSGVKGALAPMINPQRYVGEGLAAKIGPDAGQVLSNIKSAQTSVPGSMPTTAQAGAHPVLVATEKAAGNTGDFRNALAARENANNEARWNALMGVAKSPDELAAAAAARSDAVEPLYDAAFSQSANVGRGFIKFAQRPAIQKAMQQADILAKNEGQAITWPTPDNRAISGRALDYTKRALDDMIASARSAGNKQEVRALTQSRDYLTSWTNQYIPGMSDATATYAQMSVPVNTMEAGQGIANSLGNRGMNSAGIPQMTLPGYKAALVRALKDAPYGIAPDAQSTLHGIGQDLQRGTISSSLRSPGSDTAYNLNANGWLARNLYGKNFDGATGTGRVGAGIGAALGAALFGHPWAGAGIGAGVAGSAGKLGKWVGGRLNSALADALLDPQVLRPYLERQIAAGSVTANPSSQALAAALKRNLIPTTSIGGATLLNQ